jgi:hypothetical protein
MAATGSGLAEVLRVPRAPGAPAIHDIRELALGGTTDAVLLTELATRGFAALVTRDSSMLAASVRRELWRLGGVSVVVCDGKWGNLVLFEQARRLPWWWPTIFATVLAGPQGGAWRISAEMTPSGLRRMLAD